MFRLPPKTYSYQGPPRPDLFPLLEWHRNGCPPPRKDPTMIDCDNCGEPTRPDHCVDHGSSIYCEECHYDGIQAYYDRTVSWEDEPTEYEDLYG